MSKSAAHASQEPEIAMSQHRLDTDNGGILRDLCGRMRCGVWDTSRTTPDEPCSTGAAE
jgi:hypothetical protein